MEEKQLDFNAPLLSVRRHAAAAATASASVRSSGREWKSGEASERNLSPPAYKTELKSGPVRDSGAVPFVWEQIPGRPKVTSVHGSSSPKRPAPAPRLPPGKLAAKRENVPTAEDEASPAPARSLPPGMVVDSRKEIVRTAEGDGRQIGKVGRSPNDRTVQSVRPVGGAHDSVPAAKAHGSYGSKEERENLDGDDCDAFSDALETFSLAETSLFNGSVGGVSALDGQEWKRTGNSSDVQGRSFMMDRFLPAAKAMASEAPKYAPRRQLPASEPAKLVNRVQNDAQPLRSQPRPCFIQQYALPDEEEDDESEEEDEEDDDNDAGNAIPRACGVFPWSLKGSLCLTNPIFRAQRMRNKKSTSSTFVARKSNKPTKSNDSASSFSGSDEMTWEAVYRNKLVGRVQNLGLHGSGSKLSESSSSPSVYEDTANNQLISYSDSQTQNGSSSFRHSPRGISPYRNEASTSPFSERSGFLGLSKSGRSYGSDSSDANSKGLQARKNTSYLRSKGISGSLSPTVEKPLYVDPACVGDASNSKSDMLEAKELNQSVDMEASTPVEDQQKQGEPILDSFVITQQSALHVSDVGKIGNVVNLKAAKHHSGLLADIRLLSCADTSESDTGNRVASVVNLVQGVDTLDMSSKVSMPREQMRVGEHISGEQVSSRSEYSREQNSGNRSASDSEGNSPLLHSLPPLPSPKSPSESWLVRALPGFSAKGSSSSSFPQYRLKKSAAKASEPKWEIIIKSTNVDHGHLRYSEELSQTAPRQTENEDVKSL
ncbi:uncharacterized protein LOC116267196 [Nymphaea colorata]|nr:uncharacterized protein LOC116267196 [Nymphaea colorata]